MSEATPTQQLASLLLGQPVHNWIAMQRASGSSWRKIADDLNARTNGQVDVTHEAVRGWADEAAA
jgi:hypothetical protein